MVVVDVMTMETHFISIQSTFGMSQIANIFMKDIFRLHGIPKMIISDTHAKFTSNFCKGLFKNFGTKLNFITTYHLQIDDQSERKIQILEDLL